MQQINRNQLIKCFEIWSEEAKKSTKEDIAELENMSLKEYAELSADYLLSLLERTRNEPTNEDVKNALENQIIETLHKKPIK